MDRTETEQKGWEAAKNICNNLNAFGSKGEFCNGLTQALNFEHRTPQQQYGGLMIATTRHYAKCFDDGNFDLRNEALCKLCKELMPTVEKFGHLPFI